MCWDQQTASLHQVLHKQAPSLPRTQTCPRIWQRKGSLPAVTVPAWHCSGIALAHTSKSRRCAVRSEPTPTTFCSSVLHLERPSQRPDLKRLFIYALNNLPAASLLRPLLARPLPGLTFGFHLEKRGEKNIQKTPRKMGLQTQTLLKGRFGVKQKTSNSSQKRD